MAVLTVTDDGLSEAIRDAHGIGHLESVPSLIAASLRRAASLRCPSTPPAIVAAVTTALSPLPAIDQQRVTETLDQLVALGDLVEVLEQNDGRKRRMLYLGQPRYVRQPSGDLLLIGQRPDCAPLVGDDLESLVVRTGHLRRIESPGDEVVALLQDDGVEEVTQARWLRHEEPLDALDLVNSYRRVLGNQPASGEVQDLLLLDPARPADYYRGRWRSPTEHDDGMYVARRSQGYGADLWTLVEIQSGQHSRILDLPAFTSHRGCDEAWRLQAAIDSVEGHPQEVLVQPTGAGRIGIGLPSPPPRWLQRRWDLLGEPTQLRGALFAHEFAASDARGELEFVKEYLWMERRILNKGDGG